MADNTHIEWTDATWNPITGCSVTSPGCTNCYAMKLAGTRLAHHPSRAGLTQDTKAGPVWTGEVRLNEDWLTQPLKWKRPRRIFVCAHGDLFHENVPDEWIDRVFAVMALAPQHTFQVLTKRADRMRAYCQSRNSGGTSAIVAANALDNANWLSRELAVKSEPQFQNIWPLPNVWLGVSVEDQTRADERIRKLAHWRDGTPAAVRFLSCEPLLGPVIICAHCARGHHPIMDSRKDPRSKYHAGVGGFGDPCGFNGLDWIIVGGESGHGARPMHPDWARSLRDQCQSAGVSFFFKQWGEWGPDTGPLDDCYPNSTIRRDPIMEGDARCAVLVDGAWQHFESGYGAPIELCSGPGDFVYRLGKRRNGRLLDGREWNEVPV